MNIRLLLSALAIPACAFADTPTPVADPVATPAPAVPASPVADPNRTVPSPLTSPPFPGSDFTGPVIGDAPDSPSYPLEMWLYDRSALAPLKDNTIRVYGWVDVGGNVSTSKNSLAPNSYALVPNSVQLDQAVLRIERQADTSQTDHADWGFRITGIYGEDYRFTTAKGFLSDQLLKNNRLYGYDMPGCTRSFTCLVILRGYGDQNRSHHFSARHRGPAFAGQFPLFAFDHVHL